MNKHAIKQIPADVYLSFVQSLYGNRKTLYTGMISHTFVTLLIYFKTRDPVFLGAAGLLLICWFLRLIMMKKFDADNKSGLDFERIIYWEKRYIFGAALISSSLGLICGYSVLFTSDSFAQFAIICVTLGTMVSVVGRNYGSKKNVDIIAASVCLPMLVGFLAAGDVYLAIFGMLLLPFFLTTRSMANGVREFLYDNVIRRREIGIIAERFDAALNNMPHGLVMVDSEGRILVSNAKAAKLIGFSRLGSTKDRKILAVLRLASRTNMISNEKRALIEEQVREIISGQKSRALLRFSDEFYLEFTAKKRNNDGVVLIFEDVTARIKAENKITHMARFDSLTGLANRAHFSELVKETLENVEEDEEVALIMFDLDDFKHINDTKGHLTGDRLLCAIAKRLKMVSNDRMVLSRFGGDEFVIFVRDVKGTVDLENVMNYMFKAMRGSYLVNGNTLSVRFSAGVVACSAKEFVLDQMQIKADLALYESKHGAKDGWVLFANKMNEEYSSRQRLKSDIRNAIRGNGFTAMYQPMFTPDGREIVCCEALARWNHHELGPISPVVFIELAEQMGVVGEITKFMLFKACKDCKTWPDTVSVSVNLSALDLRNSEIIDIIKSALDSADLPPQRLQVEVTESAFVNDMSKAKVILNELRKMGVSIAIDDFGTGYSSLSYLDSLPLNKVKIDRSFVSNILDRGRKLKLLQGIVNLSRSIGLEVVVEGVETEEQLHLIQATGCSDYIQGYVFGRPLPNNAVVEIMQRLMPKLSLENNDASLEQKFLKK